jgi:hypothetical protein
MASNGIAAPQFVQTQIKQVKCCMAHITTLQGIGEFKEIGLKVRYSIKVSDLIGHPGKLQGEGTVESATSAPLPDLSNKRLLLTLQDGRQLNAAFLYPSTFYVVSGN